MKEKVKPFEAGTALHTPPTQKTPALCFPYCNENLCDPFMKPAEISP